MSFKYRDLLTRTSFFMGALALSAGMVGCNSATTPTPTPTPTPSATYTVGGTASGLSGAMVLQNNAGDNLSVAADGSFTFATALANGASYAVTVLSAPAGQSCTVANGSGTIAAASVSNVTVTCADLPTIDSIDAAPDTVTLVPDETKALAVAANYSDGTYAVMAAGDLYFASSDEAVATVDANGVVTGVAVGSAMINITQTSAPYLTASVNISVLAGPLAVWTVSVGTITGLTGEGLVIQNNYADDSAVASGVTSFTFPTGMNNGSTYSVTILTQPAGQTCTVSSGAGGPIIADVTAPSIACVDNFTVGGSISGLTGAGLVLQNNAGDDLTVASDATSFTFATALADTSAYAVTVATQPEGQTCTVTNGSGNLAGANVTNVTVTCVNNYTVGGTVTGLGAGKFVALQNNAGDNLAVLADGSFTFATALADTSAYAVTVLTQPDGQTCTVTNGTGNLAGANVTDVTVTCL